jgi:hypothetical protein
VECELIGHLERHQDVAARLEQEWHVDQYVADSDWLDEGAHAGPSLVGGQRERPVVWSNVILPGNLIPDCAMDALGISPGRRLQVNDQEVYRVVQELRGLLDEVLQGLATRLIALRHNLNHGDQMVARNVSNGDDILLATVEFQVRFRRNANTRFGDEDSTPRGPVPTSKVCGSHIWWLRRVIVRLGLTTALEGQDVGVEPCPLLLGKGIILVWEELIVQNIGNGTNPALVEMMKDSRANARPIMDRHERLLGPPGLVVVASRATPRYHNTTIIIRPIHKRSDRATGRDR